MPICVLYIILENTRTNNEKVPLQKNVSAYLPIFFILFSNIWISKGVVMFKNQLDLANLANFLIYLLQYHPIKNLQSKLFS